jgi:hypothetical protein
MFWTVIPVDQALGLVLPLRQIFVQLPLAQKQMARLFALPLSMELLALSQL